MRIMSKIFIIAKKTYIHQVRSWTFLIFIILPFLITSLLGVIGYLSERNTDPSSNDINRVIIVASKNISKKFIIENSGGTVKDIVNSKNSAKAKVNKSNRVGYITIYEKHNRLYTTIYESGKLESKAKEKIFNMINAYQREINISKSKIQEHQLKILSTTPKFTQITGKKSNFKQKEIQIASYLLVVFLVYLILLAYSSITAQEVASEKGSKIIEIIFSSTTPENYFYGKILGILSVMVTQLFIYTVGGIAVIDIFKKFYMKIAWISKNREIINGIFNNLINLNIIYIILGIFIYIILSAFSGALVSNNENISKASQLPIFLCMFACLLTIPFINKVNSTFVKIFSFVPFFSNFFMPMRIIHHSVSLSEIILSLIILILTILGLLLLISRIYGGLMLQTDSGTLIQRLKKSSFYKKNGI